MRKNARLQVVCLSIMGIPCVAQTPSKDEGAIRLLLSNYAQARDHHDVKAETLAYEEHADFWLFGAAPAHGRAAIEKSLEVNSSTYHFSLMVDNLRLLGNDTAIADASIVAGPEGHSINMFAVYVIRKQDSEWHIAAARVGAGYASNQAPTK